MYQKNRLTNLLLLLLFYHISSLGAQTLDGWIDDSKTYYKISCATDGIVRVPAEALSQAGVPIGAFAPQNVQFFFRGKEIPIYIKGQAEGNIEYIEFEGRKNDGWFDTGMYVTPLSQSNPYFSLVTDTSSYFLTWNNQINNLRYSDIDNTGESSTELSGAIRRLIYHQQGRYYSDDSGPEFDIAEGWFSLPEIVLGSTTTRTITLENKLPSGPVKYSCSIVGISDAPSLTGYNHHLQIRHESELLLDTLFSGNKLIKRSFEVDAMQIGEALNLNFKSINDLSVATDRMAIAVIEVEYPVTFDIGSNQQLSYIIAESGVSRYIVFKGLSQSERPRIYVPSKGWHLIPHFIESGWRVTLPPTDTTIELKVTATPHIIGSGEIKQANMQYSSAAVEYIIVSHSSLMSSAQQYAAYRSGFAVDIDVLYNRFSYGIEGHPLAIRYFLKNHIDKGNPKPTYLFLIGKGLSLGTVRSNPSLEQLNLVPVGGSLPSDMLVTTRLTQNNGIPEIMVGRLSAVNNTDVLAYLNKVIEHSNRQPSMGAKNLIHMGGGNNASEQQMFARYLSGYEDIITDTLYGGFVNTFLKNSSLPIIGSQSDSIRSLIEGGASVMVFFGHGWSGGFDQNVDDPDVYNNKGKYPFIIANSCYSGNIFETTPNTISEKWVLAKDKGALAFLASVHLGVPSYLNRFTQEFYKNIAWRSYGNSFGKNILQINNYLLTEVPNSQMRSTCLEFIYHGDPAVSPVTWALPDYMLTEGSIRLVPHHLTTAIDSFAVKIVSLNQGKALQNGADIFVERLLPSGKTQTKIVRLNKLYYSDTSTVYFPIERSDAVGINRIKVMIDYLNSVAELSENNNQQTISFTISSHEIYPIYPTNYSLNSQPSTILKASTGNPFESEQTYTFQLSSDPFFSPTTTVTTNITSIGGVIESPITRPLQHSTPYFWRVTKHQPADEQLSWHSSSFVKSDTKTGWIQQGKAQLQHNSLKFLEYNPNGQLQYLSTPRRLSCHNIGSVSLDMLHQVRFDIDGNQDYGSCGGQASMVLVVIDSLSLTPWLSSRGNYGQIDYPNCPPRTRPNNYFTFQATPDGRNKMTNFIHNTIENGCYVLAYSVRNAQFETWQNAHYSAFEMLGATQIRTVPNNFPYIFIGRKGFPNFAEEVIGDSENAEISLEKILIGNLHYGSITTPWIGPSEKWGSLQWQPDNDAIQPSDSICLKIYTKSAKFDSLVNVYGMSDTLVDLSFLNSSKHNYIKLEYFTYDLAHKTPVAPELLMVEYAPFAELAINPKQGIKFHAEKINEGDSIAIGVAITNVSESETRQFAINYTLHNTDTKTFDTETITVDSLPPYGSHIDTVKFGTRGKRGTNIITVEANYPNLKAQSFPEPFMFNNTGYKTCEIQADNKQPILTVLFDGRNIINNDIVSARPEITITLNDQNRFIPLDDTSSIEIWLTPPGSETQQRVALAHEIGLGRLQWQPASTGAVNECKIIWQPMLETDGFYKLRVKAKDISGNQAGNSDYEIRFEVINKSTITHLLNYPNPFSTSTRFVFTLTGHKLPDDLKIMIYSASGRLVRVIDRSELGQINIGQNITQFAWDGTDEFGDRLANGVYFYKVIATIDGNTAEHRASGIDKFFNNEFGKMFLFK